MSGRATRHCSQAPTPATHSVGQEGRDYWRPHTEIQKLRNQIEVLEFEIVHLHREVALLVDINDAIRRRLHEMDKRIAALDAKVDKAAK